MPSRLVCRKLLSAAVAALTGAAVSAALARAQLGDPGGPGQSVPPPPAQCPRTIACSYTEHNSLGPEGGYRFQRLLVCGANCTTQYWVHDLPSEALLLTLAPVRGGGIVAMQSGDDPADTHRPIRTVLPDYQPSDPACCPSRYADTTYTWDPDRQALVAAAPTFIEAGAFPGWDQLRQQLQSEGFFDVFSGL